MKTEISPMRSKVKWLGLAVIVCFFMALFLLLSSRKSGSSSSSSLESVRRRDWSKEIDFDHLTGTELLDYFQWSVADSCRLVHDFGGFVEAKMGVAMQKAVCMDPQVRPFSADCIVYSFGIGDEWSFEDAIAAYGCKVFTFDPSINNNSSSRSNNSSQDKIRHYNIGLGIKDEDREQVPLENEWNLQSLASIYQQMVKEGQHDSEHLIDYLKIDIEMDEWWALHDMIQSGYLSKVAQMTVRIHLPITGNALSTYRKLASVLHSIESNNSMVRFDAKIVPESEKWIEQLNLIGYVVHDLAWYNRRLQRDRTHYTFL